MRALTTTVLMALSLLTPVAGATAAADTCQGRAATIVGQEGQPLTGTEGPDVVVTGGAQTVRTLGGDDLVCVIGKPSPGLQVFTDSGDDHVEWVVGRGSGSSVLAADLGDGDDSIDTDGPPTAGARLDGGSGTDRVGVASPGSGLTLDLLTDVLKVGGPPTYTVPVAGFEDASLLSPSVGVLGTAGPNRLGTRSCFGDVVGRGGDDRLLARYDGPFGTGLDCRQAFYRFTGRSGDDRILGSGSRDEVWGGAGRDLVRGGGGNDELYGGAGRDSMTGGTGRDTCVAERQRSCER